MHCWRARVKKKWSLSAGYCADGLQKLQTPPIWCFGHVIQDYLATEAVVIQSMGCPPLSARPVGICHGRVGHRAHQGAHEACTVHQDTALRHRTNLEGGLLRPRATAFACRDDKGIDHLRT